MDALRAEVRELRRENADLSRRLEAVSGQLEVVSARVARAPAPPPSRDDAERASLVPPDLAVVRVAPPAPAPRAARTPPPVPTAIAIAAPDPERLEGLARPGARDLATEADGALRRARARPAAERVHALEEFVHAYPRHPSADNALVEAAAAAAEAGRRDAACDLARRASADYPAGDALAEALERLASCASQRGAPDAERTLLERLVTEFPRTPAAERAGARLATISGRTGETPEGPARSGP